MLPGRWPADSENVRSVQNSRPAFLSVPLRRDREGVQIEGSGSTVEGNTACIPTRAAKPEADQFDFFHSIREAIRG